VLTLPPSFFEYTRVTREGAAGRAWAESLPALVETLCARWSLRLDGELMHGANGIAVPVRREGVPYVLKVAWLDEELRAQMLCLRLWDGRGVVRLVDASVEDGALLLERLDSSRSLRAVPLEEALTIAAGLLRRLAIPLSSTTGRWDGLSVATLPTTQALALNFIDSSHARSASLGHPVPAHVLDLARDLAGQVATVSDELLVNYDLHDENILASEREPWLAIDPRIVVGVPEYGVAQLLWWRLDDMDGERGLLRSLDVIVDAADLDWDLARAWTVVRSVDYWLWGLANGLTIDPVRCARIVETLSRAG
jgi:streptomycin 6-kinase